MEPFEIFLRRVDPSLFFLFRDQTPAIHLPVQIQSVSLECIVLDSVRSGQDLQHLLCELGTEDRPGLIFTCCQRCKTLRGLKRKGHFSHGGNLFDFVTVDERMTVKRVKIDQPLHPHVAVVHAVIGQIHKKFFRAEGRKDMPVKFKL